MKQLINIITNKTTKQTAASEQVCNYRDNYYGDQICVNRVSVERVI